MSTQKAENAPCALAPPQVATRLRQYHRGLELVDLRAEGSVMGSGCGGVDAFMDDSLQVYRTNLSSAQ